MSYKRRNSIGGDFEATALMEWELGSRVVADLLVENQGTVFSERAVKNRIARAQRPVVAPVDHDSYTYITKTFNDKYFGLIEGAFYTNDKGEDVPFDPEGVFAGDGAKLLKGRWSIWAKQIWPDTGGEVQHWYIPATLVDEDWLSMNLTEEEVTSNAH